MATKLNDYPDKTGLRGRSSGGFRGKMRARFSTAIHPVSAERQALLRARWDELPESLRQSNQLVGRHWTHCGYTMGPAYCSFGCSHCYLPKGSNRQPLVSLEEMKAQITAQRRLMGEGGNLQITGGDVVDAYWRANRPDELIEVLRFANLQGLVPMLMTHGQILLDHPDYLARLVTEGGLRKMSIHIDTTMAGRPEYPAPSLRREGQLNPLRDRLVKLVLDTRRRTALPLVAAQTVTVTSGNVDSLHEIIDWLFSRTENLDVCRTLSFQPEASIGRSRLDARTTSPVAVWQAVCDAVGLDLPRDHLLVGHPDCSSIATLLVRPADRRVVSMDSQGVTGAAFWDSVLTSFGGLGASAVNPVRSVAKKLLAIACQPRIIRAAIRYFIHLVRSGQMPAAFAVGLASGRVRGVNLVMHNFMSEEEVLHSRDSTIQDRLAACAFRGVVRDGDDWKLVSMCEMNGRLRPQIYADKIADPGHILL